MESKKTSGAKGFIEGLKAEYNKIVFPTRENLTKETFATIVVSLVIGLLIAGLDLIMRTGLNFIFR